VVKTLPMKWVKKGLIFKPEGQFEWVTGYAAVPIALPVDGDIYRIYFGGRNKNNMTQPGYLEIDLNNPEKVIYLSPEPVLKLGKTGLFDDSAIWATCIFEHEGNYYMYYGGWMRGVSVPFYCTIGLAISDDGGKTFRRHSPAPIMDRNEIDPYIFGSPYVVIENGVWRMWYFSAVDFTMENNEPMNYYHIRYAESKDGINWKREGKVCIDFKYKGETRIAKPCVIKEDGLYKMWYSYAIDSYRIGYAESGDGILWERKDEEASIDVSESGWDSEMIEYPFVFEHKGRKYLLYNGNEYGKEGIGYAIMG